MKLAKVRIENFRCFEDEEILFDDYTCLVGANGSGKSTVLAALRVFFGDTPGTTNDFIKLQRDDYHNRDTTRQITITLTFSDMDTEAEDLFRHYIRQGQLVVSAVASWNEGANCAQVERFGERPIMVEFARFFEAEKDGKTKVAELREIYKTIREDFPSLPPAGTKEGMKSALNEFESIHQELCKLGRSSDLFYGLEGGLGGLERIGKLIQWICVPAVKDASTEQLEAKKNALGLILERTVQSKTRFVDRINALRDNVAKEYEQILQENQGALEALSDSLTTKLREWAHPEALLSLRWRNDPSKNISIQPPPAEVRASERGFQDADLNHFGHGLQRSYLLALLQELAGCVDTGNPRLLLACEEPELYQHPPQARHLSSVLQRLSALNSQVIVSTHSPHFVPGRGFEDVRVLRRGALDTQPCARQATIREVSDMLARALGEDAALPAGVELKIEQALQPALNEMFFADVLILLEGPEDLGYIGSYLTLANYYDELRRLGCHIVPTIRKSNMRYPLAIAKSLDIPTFVVFDADGDKTKNPSEEAQHKRDNLAILRLCGVANAEPFPKAVFTTDSVVMWPENIASAVRNDFGREVWDGLENEVRKERRLICAPDLEKNALFIGYVLAAAYKNNLRSPVLDELCRRIISFARSVRGGPTNPRHEAVAAS